MDFGLKDKVAVIGAGFQATMQVNGIVAATGATDVRIWSRTQEKREAFATRLPFDTEIVVCAGREIAALMSTDRFEGEPEGREIVRFANRALEKGLTLVPLKMYFKAGRVKVLMGIGRGRQTSDLTIKDPNVSRQHAMIEMVSGQYYMVDMGSTNGVEFNGQRVARKPISEGDVFRICDHELYFTFA